MTMRSTSLLILVAALASGATGVAATAPPSPTFLSASGRQYLYYPNSDVISVNETLFPKSNLTTIDALSALCDATPTCIGFNANGWLKKGKTSLGPNQVDVYLLAPTPAPSSPPLLVWPAPASITAGTSQVIISTSLTITATNPSNDLTAAFARYTQLLFPHGSYPGESERVSLRRKGKGLIPASLSTLSQLTVTVTDVNVPLAIGVDESYNLTIPDDGTPAVLTANTVYGAYHGLETFSQLVVFDFESHAYWVPGPVSVFDAPVFTWRGLMIDPARRYLPMNTIRQVVDSMTYAKLNALHVHIVDCDSWPIEVDGDFPNLWQGAFSPRERYTTQDLAYLVEYGRQRGIRIIYEYDTPGHSGSMCDAYPDLCPNATTCREPLNPASPNTLPAISSVISSLAAVSIDAVLHLGGDEVNPACWEESPAVQAWMAANNFTETDQVYSYFVAQTNDMALALDKSPMRWEEVWKHFGTKLDPRTIIHAWLSSEALINATNSGYRVVYSVDSSGYYLDYLDVMWDTVYSVDILEGQTNQSAIPLVLGGELAMWGETVDAASVLSVVWPRLAAGAERLWSYNFGGENARTSQDWDVITRLSQFRCLLLERGVPAPNQANPQAGSLGVAWSVGSCGGGYKALC